MSLEIDEVCEKFDGERTTIGSDHNRQRACVVGDRVVATDGALGLSLHLYDEDLGQIITVSDYGGRGSVELSGHHDDIDMIDENGAPDIVVQVMSSDDPEQRYDFER